MPVPAWLEGRGGRPEGHCHREMIDAVRYVVDNGGKWRAIPVDFPWWRAVYDFFRRWCRHGYVRELYQRLRRLERKGQGREAEPTAAVVDAQSVDGSDTVGADSQAAWITGREVGVQIVASSGCRVRLPLNGRTPRPAWCGRRPVCEWSRHR
jgi:transposase